MKYRIKEKFGSGFFVEVKDYWFTPWGALGKFKPYHVTSYFTSIEEAEECVIEYKFRKLHDNKLVKEGLL